MKNAYTTSMLYKCLQSAKCNNMRLQSCSENETTSSFVERCLTYAGIVTPFEKSTHVLDWTTLHYQISYHYSVLFLLYN